MNALHAVADDGDPDPTFSGDGKAWTLWDPGFVQAETNGVLTLTDGSVVTAGWVDRGSNNRDFAVAKFRADGSLDTAFGDQGQRVVAFDLIPGGDDRALGIFPTGFNQLLVVGTAGVSGRPYQHIAFLRLNADGSPDATFGVGGKQVNANNPWGASANIYLKTAVLGTDGKIVMAGLCTSCGFGGPSNFVVVRLFPSVVTDLSFGSGGWASFGRSDPDDGWLIEEANAVAVDRLGRIVLAGHEETWKDAADAQRPLLLRLTSGGQLDASFGGTGYVLPPVLGSWDITAIAADPVDASLVIAVNVTNMPAVAPAALLLRIGANGVVDNAFGQSGVVNLAREEGTSISALAIRADRRITAAGWINPSGDSAYDFFVARTLANGTLDATFDGNGVKRIAFDIIGESWDKARVISLSAQRPVIAGPLHVVIGTPQFATGVLRLQSDLLF
ncbi:MAG: delta-60 repeat domain-containing protein, partial [Dokdonella sp.]